MILDLSFFAVFVGSATAASMLVWRKIPLLLQVPHQLIEESFVTRPSRLKRWEEGIARFIRERRYYDFWYSGALGFLGMLRVRLLRMERSVFQLATILEVKSRDFSEERQRYWESLKGFKTETRPEPELVPETAVVTPIAPPIETASLAAAAALAPIRIEGAMQSTVFARPKRLRLRPTVDGMEASQSRPRRISKKTTAAVGEDGVSVA